MNRLLERLDVEFPLIQAPMAGVSTPAMAAAVSNAGGIGSIGVGNLDAERARHMIRDVKAATGRPFNVNVFCHPPAIVDPEIESAWLRSLTPHFANFGAAPPTRLSEIYTSFLVDDVMLAVLLAERPTIVSFHFGLPAAEKIAALKSAGVFLLATATNLAEGRLCHAAGIDAIVAQGHEAGGHRGMFDPGADDECLSTLVLTRLLVDTLPVPIIAAGGIMDGAGIAAALTAGACAAQLGTAFILCPESSADAGYREALLSRPALRTVMTSAISGRPARSVANRFTEIGETVEQSAIPAYPRAYDAGKELHAAAKRAGEFGYGAQWAGQGVAQCRALPAAELVHSVREELAAALAASGKHPTTIR